MARRSELVKKRLAAARPATALKAAARMSASRSCIPAVRISPTTSAAGDARNVARSLSSASFARSDETRNSGADAIALGGCAGNSKLRVVANPIETRVIELLLSQTQLSHN